MLVFQQYTHDEGLQVEIPQRLCHLPLVMDVLRRSRVLETIDHAIGQHVLSEVSTGECVAVILAGVFVGAHVCGAFATAWLPNAVSLGAQADTTRPTISSAIPVDAAVGIAVNQSVTATFSEEMDPATITSATMTLKQGATAVAGAVTYVGITATFIPTADLAAGIVYTATITTRAKDLAGNALASAQVWTFTTSAASNGASSSDDDGCGLGSTGVIFLALAGILLLNLRSKTER